MNDKYSYYSDLAELVAPENDLDETSCGVALALAQPQPCYETRSETMNDTRKKIEAEITKAKEVIERVEEERRRLYYKNDRLGPSSRIGRTAELSAFIHGRREYIRGLREAIAIVDRRETMKTVHATIMNSGGFIRAKIVDEGTVTQIASSADPATGYEHCAAAVKTWAAENGYDCPPFAGTACLTRADCGK